MHVAPIDVGARGGRHLAGVRQQTAHANAPPEAANARAHTGRAAAARAHGDHFEHEHKRLVRAAGERARRVFRCRQQLPRDGMQRERRGRVAGHLLGRGAAISGARRARRLELR